VACGENEGKKRRLHFLQVKNLTVSTVEASQFLKMTLEKYYTSQQIN
jgi:hypothetical protein